MLMLLLNNALQMLDSPLTANRWFEYWPEKLADRPTVSGSAACQTVCFPTVQGDLLENCSTISLGIQCNLEQCPGLMGGTVTTGGLSASKPYKAVTARCHRKEIFFHILAMKAQVRESN